MLDQISQLVLYFFTVSIAAERLTEIFKRTIVQKTNYLPKFNGAIYQIVSGLFGMGVAFKSPPNFDFFHMNQYAVIVITGLAVSGGSGAWNSVLEFLKQAATVKPTDPNNAG